MTDKVCSRRGFVHTLGSCGVAAMVLRSTDALSGHCAYVNDANQNFNAQPSFGTVRYWIDGMHFGADSDLPSRANIALFVDVNQTASSFVSKVFLTDPDNNVLAAQFLSDNEKTISGKVPYIIFENIALDPATSYRIVFVIKEGAETTEYVSTVNPGLTAYDVNHQYLPNRFRTDLGTFLVDGSMNITPGLLSSPFRYFTDNGLSHHCARARFNSIGVDGSFSVNVDFMHGDANASHFMRYFIVLDPVGRILGFHKRDFADPNKNSAGNLVVNGSHAEIVRLSDDLRTCFDPQTNTQTGVSKMAFYDIPASAIADIRDCPYVQVVTDCNYDGVFKSTIRLR